MYGLTEELALLNLELDQNKSNQRVKHSQKSEDGLII